MVRRVAVLGKGSLAIRIAEWFRLAPDYELRVVVPVIPEPEWTDSLATWAAAHDVAAVASGDYRELHDLDSLDLVFSVFYDRILSAAFLARCRRALNLHNGPLPRYRGVSPINWALKQNESTHGVTIHEITPGIDDGPIVAQLLYSIYPTTDEVRDVYERSLTYGWTLFEQTMPILDRIEPRPQDESQALYFSAKQNGKLGERRFFTRRESAPR
jgi:methionyl-tRNA formyltransferase